MSSAFWGAGGMGVAVGVYEQIIVRNGDVVETVCSLCLVNLALPAASRLSGSGFLCCGRFSCITAARVESTVDTCA